MKLAIVGDMHWLGRSASPVFNEFFIKAWKDEYFPLLESHGIKDILQLGDLFDNRKNVSTRVLKDAKRGFFDKLEQDGYNFITLAGNHDLYWRENLEVITSELVLSEYKNIRVISEPTVLVYEDTTIDVIPWMCKSNEDEIKKFVARSKSDICAGHWEIENFAMFKGMESKHGIDPKMFERYEQVWSGHYHTRSTKDNITYVGVPYEMCWSDFNDQKGIHIFDTETRELTFYPLTLVMHERIEYDDTKERTFSYTHLAGKYVRINVVSKTDPIKFEAFMARVNTSDAIDVKVIENNINVKNGDVDEEIELDDTLSIVSNYIDNVEMDVSKDDMKEYFNMLHAEAVSITE